MLNTRTTLKAHILSTVMWHAMLYIHIVSHILYNTFLVLSIKSIHVFKSQQAPSGGVRSREWEERETALKMRYLRKVCCNISRTAWDYVYKITATDTPKREKYINKP